MPAVVTRTRCPALLRLWHPLSQLIALLKRPAPRRPVPSLIRLG